MGSPLMMTGELAVVTGAGRGIGRAIALRLAAAGADVVLAARTVSELEETAAEVRALGPRAVVAPTDVTIEADCERLIALAEEMGGVSTLVNNAGGARFVPFWEMTTAEFDLAVDVNLRATFFCSRPAARAMMGRGRGAIVNIASSAGKKPYARQSAYCAAKAGVVALSKVMALELRPHGIRVHVVCPGAVDTRMADQVHPERQREGWMQPEDVADAVSHVLAYPPNVTVDEIVLRRFLADPM